MELKKVRGFWKNVENIFFAFIPEYSRTNLASHQHYSIVEECNLSMCYQAFLGRREIQNW